VSQSTKQAFSRDADTPQRKTLYDATPPKQKGRKIEPALAVLGEPVQGSEIGRENKESDTLLINSVEIRTADEDNDDPDNTPYIQWLDTPGLFDSRGPLIEIVNIISIATCVAKFKTLRIVVMVPAHTLSDTGEGFTQCVEAISTLFGGSGCEVAKKCVQIWLNPKQNEDENEWDPDGVIEEIKQICKARKGCSDADKKIRDFLKVIIDEHKTRGNVVQVLTYKREESWGDERLKIIEARQQSAAMSEATDDIDVGTPIYKIVFPTENLLKSLMRVNPMKEPAAKVGLPLTKRANAEIKKLADELRDYIDLRCDLKDYKSVLKDLDCLRGLSKFMNVGKSDETVRNTIEATYCNSVQKVLKHLKITTGKDRMEELCQSFDKPVAMNDSDFDDICVAMRAATACKVLHPHLSKTAVWNDLGDNACCKVVCEKLLSVEDQNSRLLDDHLIKDTSETQMACAKAARIFGQKVKLALTNLRNANVCFALEARFDDGTRASFATVNMATRKSLNALYQTLHKTFEAQKKTVAEKIQVALTEAESISRDLQNLNKLNEQELEDFLERTVICGPVGPFDAVFQALEVVKIAEENLAGLVIESLHDQYLLLCEFTISELQKQSEMAIESIENAKELACVDKYDPLMSKLLFLLWARSSDLRKHFASNPERYASLNQCYEGPVNKIVEWHTAVVKEVLEASSGCKDFTRRLSDYKQPIELSMEIAKFSSVEKTSVLLAIVSCDKWDVVTESQDKLIKSISISLEAFSLGVESRLKDHRTVLATSNLKLMEDYDYTEHTKDLAILEGARWCDTMLDKPIIEEIFVTAWLSFESHMKILAEGEDGVISQLRKGMYSETCTLLVQIHRMQTLWQSRAATPIAETSCKAEVAQRVKKIHDTVHEIVSSAIKDKCEKARLNVLERAGPTGNERSDWWMDINVKDPNVTDALWHLNSLLDLAQCLMTSSGSCLSEWLSMDELKRQQRDCTHRAKEILDRVRQRVKSMFSALGSCELLRIKNVVERLASDEIFHDAEEEALDDSVDATQNQAVMRNRNAILAACRELKDILQLLSSPSTYPAIFAATIQDADSDSLPNDLAILRELERVFHNAYIESINHFGDEETGPAARQKVLHIYNEFAQTLPSTRIFEQFKKTATDLYPTLLSAHQSARRSENKELKSALLINEFTDETFHMMVDLCKSGEDDERARVAYVLICGMLANQVRNLIRDFKMNFVHLLHPQHSFSTHEHLVKPWNQLHSARLLECFLEDAPGDTPINLDAEIAQALQNFEEFLKERVIIQFAKMFDLGDFSSAEGSDTFGLKHISILVMQLQNAEGGNLYEVASNRLDEERARQKHQLGQIHLVRLVLPSPTEGQNNAEVYGERTRLIDQYLDQSFGQIRQISLCKADCDIFPEYSAAAKLIKAEVRKFLSVEFQPLMKDGYFEMQRENVDYLETLIGRINTGPYAIDISQMHRFDLAKQNIEQYRQMHQYIREDDFGSMKPEDQAKYILSFPTQHKSYILYLQLFDSAHKVAIQHGARLLESITPHSNDNVSRQLDETFDEVRARSKLSKDLRGSKINIRELNRLEGRALELRGNVEYQLTSARGLFSETPDENDDTRVISHAAKLLFLIQTYTSLIKIAPCMADASTSRAPHILSLLKTKLKETLVQYSRAIETPKHVSLKHHAMLRLQGWEPAESISRQHKTMFETASELEFALQKEGLGQTQGSISDMFLENRVEQCVSYEHRISKVRDEIMGLIYMTKNRLDAPYDAKVDLPLDAKSFEVIFSPEMDLLIKHVDETLRRQVCWLKNAVEDKGKKCLEQLEEKLSEKKNIDAAAVLESFRFLEPLASLNALSGFPDSKAFDDKLRKHAEDLALQIRSEIRMSQKNSERWQMLPQVATLVILLQKFGSDVPRAAPFSNEVMGQVLDLAKNKFGIQGMQQLAVALRECEPALGNEIVETSSAFVQITIAEFNQNTQRDISVVKKLYASRNGGADGASAVWNKYQEFDNEYRRLVNVCLERRSLGNGDTLTYLVQEAKKNAQLDKDSWSLGKQQHIPKVLGAVFAWWSIEFFQEQQDFNQNNSRDPVDLSYLLRPNNAQVVCILKLLGCSTNTVNLQNHLAEVPTGEGKSVIIGVLATTLGLYGFSVDCVCYSSNLSFRDQQSFLSMFMSFGLAEEIMYGTFDTLFENIIREQYGEYRDSVQQYISTGTCAMTQGAGSSRPRVLIIDEVDVFCSKIFFGGGFSPAIVLHNEQIADLMKHVWSMRAIKRLDMDSFKGHSTYRAVLASGILKASNEWLLEIAVQKMHSAKNGSNNPYILRNGRLLYKTAGRDEYRSVNFCYRTNADYLAEFDRGNLTEQQLRARLELHIEGGSFAFAKFPSMFKHILGVTGTLADDKLPPQMKNILTQMVGIKDFTYCASMYHEQKRDFEPTNPNYVRLAKDEDEHYNLIVDEIENRLSPTTNIEGERSVLVFFREADEISKFRDSSYFAKFKEKAQVLTELTASKSEERVNIIKKTTVQGMVTLATRMFGRGTDFKIFDERVKKAGGMHVLQTFFSSDLSEEVQIQGRCARQGNKGSYSQVLLQTSVAMDIDVTVETIESWSSAEVYTHLARLRHEKGSEVVRQLREQATVRLKEHDTLAISLQSFQRGDTIAFDSLLRRFNEI